MNVVAHADVGWICNYGAGKHTAIVADRVQFAVAAHKFGVFLGSRTAEFDKQSPELAVAHGKVAKDFLKSRFKHFPDCFSVAEFLRECPLLFCLLEHLTRRPH